MTDESSVRTAYEAIGEVPTVLVNNAGGGRLDRIADGATGENDAFDPFGSVDAFRDMVDLNLTSAHVVTRVIGPDLSEGAAICNTASIAGLRPGRLFSYGAAKAGLIHWTFSMAQALAPRKIRVNAVAPGIIAGDLSDAVFDESEIDALVPMKRAGRADEVAALVAFLVSEESAYISGQIIGINGAMI